MGAAVYRWVRQLTAGCGGPLPGVVAAVGCSSLLLGAVVYHRGRLLPLGAVACRRMQQLIAEYGGLPLGAAGHCRVRTLIAG